MRRALSLALSLIACLLLMAIWIRSYSITDNFFWGTAKSDHHFYATGGRLIYADTHWPNGRAPFALTHNRIPRHSPVWLEQPGHSDGFRTLGFEYSTEVFPEMDLSLSFFIPPYRIIAIPYWAPSAIVMLHPLAHLIGRSRLNRRKRRGLCVSCGYDLRASGTTCPECGAAVAA